MIKNLSVAAILFLTGCATMPVVTDMDAQKITSMCAVTRDDFKKITAVTSPRLFFRRETDLVTQSIYKLVAERKDGEQPRYFVVIDTRRGQGRSWAFWKEAYDKDGKRFPLSRETQEVFTGSLVWEVASAP